MPEALLNYTLARQLFELNANFTSLTCLQTIMQTSLSSAGIMITIFSIFLRLISTKHEVQVSMMGMLLT